MKQNEVNIAGLGVFHGDIDAEVVRCSGMGKAAGSINCRRMEISGMFTASGKIHAEEVDVKGFLRCKANFSAEKFTVVGAVVIDALLNAGNIDIQFSRFGRISEVGGENVNIRPISAPYKGTSGRALDSFINVFTSRRFKVGTVEGNDIYLENVDVDTVRGENVTVGPNCKVRYLEYAKKAKVHDSARVEQMKGQKPGEGSDKPQ